MKEAVVDILVDAETMTIWISDQGVGFNLQAALASGNTIGLAGMRERAQLLNGNLAIDASVSNGTSLKASLPLGD